MLRKLSAIEKNCFSLIGEEFNLGSPKQVGEILFDKLGIKGGKKTPSGSWSTDADTLTFLASNGHAASKITFGVERPFKTKINIYRCTSNIY